MNWVGLLLFKFVFARAYPVKKEWLDKVSVVLPSFIRFIRFNVSHRSMFSAQSTEATRLTQSGRNAA